MSWIAAAVIGSAVIGGVAASSAADKQAGAAKDAAALQAQSAAQQTALQREMYEQTRDDQEPWRNTGGAALNQLSLRAGLATQMPGAESYDDLYESIYADQITALTPKYRYPKSGNINYPALEQAAMRAAKPLAQQQFDAQQVKQRAWDEQQAKDPSTGSLMRPFGTDDFEADPGYAFRQSEGNKMVERSAAARGGLLSGSAIKAGHRFGQDLASQEYQNAYNRFQSNQSNQFNRLASLAGVGQTANNALQQAGGNYANAVTGISQANAANQGNALMAAGNARASGYAGIGNALSGAVQNWPQQQQPAGYQVPQGYSLGSGYLGNAAATSQGYQPLDYGTYNSMGGYYDN
jgi:hypothetical protein